MRRREVSCQIFHFVYQYSSFLLISFMLLYYLNLSEANCCTDACGAKHALTAQQTRSFKTIHGHKWSMVITSGIFPTIYLGAFFIPLCISAPLLCQCNITPPPPLLLPVHFLFHHLQASLKIPPLLTSYPLLPLWKESVFRGWEYNWA